jgi:anti-anti-sigma factor
MNHDCDNGNDALQHSSEENAIILECRGPIVFHWEACCFRTLVLGALSIHNAVQLDFTNVPVIDAFGLGTLVEVYSRARFANKSVQIVSVSPFVRQLLELTNLDKLLGGAWNPSYPVVLREHVA